MVYRLRKQRPQEWEKVKSQTIGVLLFAVMPTTKLVVLSNTKANSKVIVMNSSDTYCLAHLECVGGRAAMSVLISLQMRKECSCCKGKNMQSQGPVSCPQKGSRKQLLPTPVLISLHKSRHCVLFFRLLRSLHSFLRRTKECFDCKAHQGPKLKKTHLGKLIWD